MSRKRSAGSTHITQQVLKQRCCWRSKINCRYGVTSTVTECTGHFACKSDSAADSAHTNVTVDILLLSLIILVSKGGMALIKGRVGDAKIIKINNIIRDNL